MLKITRPPDHVIGPLDNPYMERWYVIPRNKWFNIYLHKISRSDDDRALHDHRADNLSIVLRGSYTEIMHPAKALTAWAPGDGAYVIDAAFKTAYLLEHTVTLSRKRGAIVYRKAEHPHRLVVEDGQPVWTLWFKFGDRRDWGFCTYDSKSRTFEWMQWEDYEAKYKDDLWT